MITGMKLAGIILDKRIEMEGKWVITRIVLLYVGRLWKGMNYELEHVL